VTYYKPEDSPGLLAKRIADTDDLRIPMTAAEFLAQAWKLANSETTIDRSSKTSSYALA